MFNIGPLELMVLAIVGVIVIGPEKLPNLMKDAARMIRSLREMATGAQQQLRDELGPEFADVDLRNLNPKTALKRAVFGDDEPLADLRKFDPRRFDARSAADTLLNPHDDEPTKNGAPAANGAPTANGARANGSARPSVSMDKPAAAPAPERARPRPRPRPSAAPFDDDAT